MGTGAVITINSANSLFGSSVAASFFSPSGFELFSDIINPIESARATGRAIKSELSNISLQLEISSTVDKLLKRDSEISKAKKEVIENAKYAKSDQDVVYGALTNVKDKLSEFGDTVIAVDNRAASLIRERKLEFNKRYPHLESESEYRKRMDERSGWEKFTDFGYGFIHGYGLIGGIDALINGRERFDEHKEAIKQKITEFACKVGEWVKKNWEALVAAIVVVVAAIVCIATFGAGTVFLVASLASFAYAVADKIVAINNNGKGIVETLEANGFHHLSQFCKGFNWGLQITMVISGFKMTGTSFSFFKSSGFWATVGNGALMGGGYNLAVDLTAYGLNFTFSEKAQSNPSEYFKMAFKDTLKDTISGFVVGGTVAGVSYIAINGYSFFRAKFNKSPQSLKLGDDFNIVANDDGTFNINGKNYYRDEIINPQTGEFYYKYGEMRYNPDDVFGDLYQNTHVSNSQARHSIQKNAIEVQLKNNPDYFKQFDCDKTNADDIIKWFQNQDTLVLHETLNGKVQIVPSGLNKNVIHAGGTSLESLRINSAINYEKYIDQLYHDPNSPLRNMTIGEIEKIYSQFNGKLYNPTNYNIDILRLKGKGKFVSDIFGFNVP